MKFTKSILIALGMVALVSASAVAAESGEREVNIGVSSVFVPAGFDSNSSVNVVVNGLFPNSCYRWNRAEVVRNAGVIEVRPMAVVRTGMCMMVLVPFTSEVQLGKLGRGEHVVHFLAGDGTYLEKKISIEE